MANHNQQAEYKSGSFGDTGGQDVINGSDTHHQYSSARHNGLIGPHFQREANSRGHDLVNGEGNFRMSSVQPLMGHKRLDQHLNNPPQTMPHENRPSSTPNSQYGNPQATVSQHYSFPEYAHQYPPASSFGQQMAPSSIQGPPATRSNSLDILQNNTIQPQSGNNLSSSLQSQHFKPLSTSPRYPQAPLPQDQSISTTQVSNDPTARSQNVSLHNSSYPAPANAQHLSSPSSLAGYQRPVVMQSLPRQTYSSFSGPPLSTQQQVSQASLLRPPLPGQTYVPQKHGIVPPPLPNQARNARLDVTSPPSGRTCPPTTGLPNLAPHAGSMPPPQATTEGIRPLVDNQATYPPAMHNLANSMSNMGVNDSHRPVNLIQESRILPNRKPIENPLKFDTSCDRGVLSPPNRKNCQPAVLRCTLKALPHTQGLLNKVKLPLGLVIHPFKDLSSLPVMSTGTIVRCKRCRTYINPFVAFVDERRWRCNMCFVVNEVPEEFLHHPISKTYGQPHTRPECTNSTIEFIAPQEYMLRPPQPAVYLFLMDVSHSAIETGYLHIVCESLLEHLDGLPGDARTKVGFLTYNQTVHFYRMSEGLAQPQMIVVSDIDDVFVPTPENLLVNLRESKHLVEDLLHQLPKIHILSAVNETDTYSAVGAALEVAKKLMSSSGGRVTVFQQSLPSIGPGKVEARENPNARAGDVATALLNPAIDFYKKMALDCSGNQIAIDIFFFNSNYIDIATLSCASRYSSGDLHHYPALHTVRNPLEAERLRRDLERYLTRKIGFESVMRIRCTKGLALHTFHGNFFVRSTDLLSLANINPDSGYAVNLAIEDSLTELSAACFQVALLYTTSKGERRIRVHTMCVPVVKTPAEVFNSVDCTAVVALLSKMAVDRAVTASISDARDALMNAVIDPLKNYKETLLQGMAGSGVLVPPCLRLFPLYIHCMLKHPAFRSTTSTKVDDRVFGMINFKMQPASYLLQDIHPDLYRVDNLASQERIRVSDQDVPQPPLHPLTAESLSFHGSFLLDCGWRMYLLVGRSTDQSFINDVLGYPQFSSIEEPLYVITERDNPTSELFHAFTDWLRDARPHHAPIRVIRDDSQERHIFHSYLHQDRTGSSTSLQDFLLHIQNAINK